MDTIEYRTLDKADWGAGEWQNEPDKRQWPDAETGLPCLAVRASHGGWCGYVGVSEGHPWFGKGYSQGVADPTCDETWCSHSPESAIEVHGGLTFADKCAGGDEKSGICHVPGPSEPDHVWWFGFDCAHAGDWLPAHAKYHSADYSRVLGLGKPTGWGGVIEYRNLAYIEDQCRSLAKQLAAIAPATT